MKENIEQNNNFEKPKENSGFQFSDTKAYNEYTKKLNDNIEAIKKIRRDLGLPDINNNPENKI